MEATRRYRKKPLAVFENGTRLYAPCPSQPRYRVVARDISGDRLFFKFDSEADARIKARLVSSSRTSAQPRRSADQSTSREPSPALSARYLTHLTGRSAWRSRRPRTSRSACRCSRRACRTTSLGSSVLFAASEVTSHSSSPRPTADRWSDVAAAHLGSRREVGGLDTQHAELRAVASARPSPRCGVLDALRREDRPGARRRDARPRECGLHPVALRRRARQRRGADDCSHRRLVTRPPVGRRISGRVDAAATR